MLRFLIDGMSYQSVIITWIVDVYIHTCTMYFKEKHTPTVWKQE